MAAVQEAVTRVSSFLSNVVIPVTNTLGTQEALREQAKMLKIQIANTTPNDIFTSDRLSHLSQRLAQIDKYLQSDNLIGSQLPEVAAALSKLHLSLPTTAEPPVTAIAQTVCIKTEC